MCIDGSAESGLDGVRFLDLAIRRQGGDPNSRFKDGASLRSRAWRPANRKGTLPLKTSLVPCPATGPTILHTARTTCTRRGASTVAISVPDTAVATLHGANRICDSTLTASGLKAGAAGPSDVRTDSQDVTVTWRVVGCVSPDTTAPVVTITLPNDGGDGWYNAAETAADSGAVLASVTATDAVGVKTLNCTGPGVSTGTPTGLNTTSASAQLTITGEGSRTVTCSATDARPNTGSDSKTVAIDTIAPAISKVVAPGTPNGLAGWYTTVATVTWTITGAEGGSLSGNCATSLVNTLDFDTDSVGIVFGCSATDTHGNSSSDSVNLRRDAAAPTVTWTSGTPADHADTSSATRCPQPVARPPTPIRARV